MPLYVQLADALQHMIAQEELRPGDLMPSETVLAGDNELSRATVIKAFDLLVERGLVVRRQGKGTFVTTPPMKRILPEFTSFSEHVKGLGLRPGNTLLSFAAYPGGSDDRPDSPFPAIEPITVFERLRLVDGTPVGIHRTIVSTELAARIGLSEQVASTPDYSFYDSLRHRDVVPSTGEERLRAINSSAADAELLNIEPGTALMEAVRESRDSRGELIESVRARYIGSQYRYHVQLSSDGRTATQLGGGTVVAESQPA